MRSSKVLSFNALGLSTLKSGRDLQSLLAKKPEQSLREKLTRRC
jgi:hypothetical protein